MNEKQLIQQRKENQARRKASCEHAASKRALQEKKKRYYRDNPHLKWNEHG